MKIVEYKDIDGLEWDKLVQSSSTGTWFQTLEAYIFFASQPDLFLPFAIGLTCDKQPHSIRTTNNQSSLRGVCVGYVPIESQRIKHFFSRRAIIIGGPCLADDATEEEIIFLMTAVRKSLTKDYSLPGKQPDVNIAPIYIETRNFNDYSQWKGAFEKAGFGYEPHLNFRVHTNQPWDVIEANIGKHRRKYIRLSFRDGATIEEHPTIEQVRAYYDLLSDLYKTKVKMPLQPWSFFERLYYLDSCIFLLVMYDGQIVGGSTCMLLPGHGVYEWYACGKDGVYKNIHPSSVTKYAGMKYAFDNGYAIFDMMGAGKPDEEYGVRDFKVEFGGELVEHGRFLCVTKSLLYKIGVLGVTILKKIK